MRRWRALRVTLAACACAAPAHAAPQSDAVPLTLEWSAPEGCPNRARVLEQVISTLGSSSMPRNAVHVHATASFDAALATAPTDKAGTWRVVIVSDGPRELGRRELEAESCEAAATATALIVALLVDPTRVGSDASTLPGGRAPDASDIARPEGPPAPTSGFAATPSRSLLPPPRSREEAPRFERARVVTLTARLAVAADLGTLSHADLGGELLLAALAHRVRLELNGSYWAVATATPAGYPSEGARLHLATVGARGGYRFETGLLAVTPVAGAELELVSASGFGGNARLQQSVWVSAVDFGATLSRPVGRRWEVSMTLLGVVPAARPPFVASQGGSQAELVVDRASPVSGRAFLGLELRFW